MTHIFAVLEDIPLVVAKDEPLAAPTEWEPLLNTQFGCGHSVSFDLHLFSRTKCVYIHIHTYIHVRIYVALFLRFSFGRVGSQSASTERILS